jgi:RNA polymerase sigma-70 factor (ECF subfamily)
MDSINEHQAIAQLKAGDISGLAFLVRQHQLKAVRAAYLITQNRSLAEDIVQAAYIRVYERIHQFDSSRPFAPWFFRIVTNDATKAVSRGPSLQALPDDPGPDHGGGKLLDDSDPADVVEMEEFKQMVRRSLGQLSPYHREVIVMRYFLDMSEQEMAEQMRVPPGTIKSRLNAARRQLKRLLQSSHAATSRVLEDKS